MNVLFASSHPSKPYLSGSSDSPAGVNVSPHACLSLQFIDDVSVDRNSRVNADVQTITEPKSQESPDSRQTYLMYAESRFKQSPESFFPVLVAITTLFVIRNPCELPEMSARYHKHAE